MSDGISLEPFLATLKLLGLPEKTVLAVSGGRDSMVLAWICAKLRGDLPTEFIAVTVDHDLREGSDDEARRVQTWCNALGLPHEIHSWHGERPISGIQAKARDARYRLLVEAAYHHGADAILTGHTLSDLAETVLMRLTRGTGPAGLAGMAQERPMANGPGKVIRLLRPMLSFSRDVVTDFASEKNIKFINDPSNDNDDYERVRHRALLHALQEQGILTPQALARTAGRMHRQHQYVTIRLRQDFLHMGGVFYGWGGVGFAQERVTLPTAAPVLARAVYAAGAADYVPDEEDAACAADQALCTGRATLAGAMLISRGGDVLVVREPAALTYRGKNAIREPIDLPSGGAVLWDRRFVIRNRAGAPSCQLRLTGDDAALPGGLPPEVSKTLPAVYRSDTEGQGQFWPALPGHLPHGLTMVSLLQERFEGNVIRLA